MTDWTEFKIGGCPPEFLCVLHEKCGWSWDTWDWVTLTQIVEIVNAHECEEEKK